MPNPRASFLASCFALAASAAPTTQHKTCEVPSQYASSNGTADDSPAIAKAFADCADGGTICFAEGVEYNVFKPIEATNLSHVTIEMMGNLNLPQDIPYVQNLSVDHWFVFEGPGLHYISTTNVSTGWINSYGQAWWDANEYPNTGIDGRPHLISIDTTGGKIQNFKSRKPIAWGMSVDGSDIEIDGMVVDAYSATGSFPFNTDGMDLGGTDITVTNSVIYNGDDAFAINDGAHNVYIKDATIGYQTHGMSIGSLGSDQAEFANVSNITFDGVSVINGIYGARFKSWQGGQGLAKDITWKNIDVYNVTFPIFVTQTYIDQGDNDGEERPNNSSVNMENFTWTNWTGTINTYMPGDGSCASDPCWYNVGLPNLAHTEAVILECNSETSCQDFELSNIQVMPQSMEPPTVICMNAEAELNPDLGFDCRNGTFVPMA
ncbi:hypothetical protein KC338_g7565 [Hortaea werneckii]|uniref:galacturonan 1,4-alpha-galacturonidase n=2 Tax=Hortaea werneckii TaxID=91943 RepID=A0A3M7E0J6_HORWE|nr:hypothetical protein KC323_g8259 [Hortaea werneckii]KAI6858813.1 hypothetical protein KC338_g7565 [Hortaea werneckii]RMY69900.1 hypothetical protein D0862_14815 [Hortaea werneckii]